MVRRILYYPDAAFDKAHGRQNWTGGKVAVVTQPPHGASWFHASRDYEEGSQR